VGLPVRLPELTPEQVYFLAQRYGLRWSATSEAAQLTAVVGGHPYLVQLALYHLQRNEITLNELLATALTQAGIYSSYLRHQWQTLQGHPELLAALKTAIKAETTGVQLEPTLAYKLESMGLVQLQGNQARVSCQLYRHYFRDRLP
jgi:serine/threonine-protein kinase